MPIKENSETTLAGVRRDIRALGSPERAKHSLRFFRTGPGEYGEGDRFHGLTVPEMRAIAKQYRDLRHDEVLELLRSEWHEDRLVALLLLVDGYKRGNETHRRKIHRAYLANTRWINNWDLVDMSAGQVVGGHLDADRISLLEKLARSKDLWERRIAIVATLHFIKRDQFGPTLRIAGILLEDSHDLIHKAVGWMLREVGKRDRAVLDAFLAEHYRDMPRTMLRYAIERHPETMRKRYLTGTI
ncbi:MAG TPA: DNA alkylation repair protein [Gemmatimonadaceae bacterium]|nr:DNA alkylation repair protein [Gemmatimonadaceae bacterium]